jgi:hypothetical protein
MYHLFYYLHGVVGNVLFLKVVTPKPTTDSCAGKSELLNDTGNKFNLELKDGVTANSTDSVKTPRAPVEFHSSAYGSVVTYALGQVVAVIITDRETMKVFYRPPDVFQAPEILVKSQNSQDVECMGRRVHGMGRSYIRSTLYSAAFSAAVP